MMKLNKLNKKKKKVKNATDKNFDKGSIKVFRSNRFAYALVLDENSRVMKSFSTKGLEGSKKDVALLVGELAGKFMIENKIKRAFFDRNGYKYHGRVKAVADGARKVGVIF